jgi:hypothetical protein
MEEFGFLLLGVNDDHVMKRKIGGLAFVVFLHVRVRMKWVF